MSPPDEPVVGDHGSSDATEQDTVGTEVVGEGRRRGVEKPGVHTDTDYGGDVTTSSDIDISGEEGGQVTSSRDRVGSDVQEELDIDEAQGDLNRLKNEEEREEETKLTKASPARVLGDGSTSSILSIMWTTSQI